MSHHVQRRYARRRMLPVAALVAAALLVIAVDVTRPSSAAAAGSARIFDPDSKPVAGADPDTSAVELGVTFSSATAGWVTAVDFYRTTASTGPYVAQLWSSSGARLARQAFSSTTYGWQTVKLAAPIKIAAGTRYTASYTAPHGRYADDANFFSTAKPYTRNGLTAYRGVYSYSGTVPTSVWQNSNYYVDVQFSAADPGAVPTTAPTTSTSRTATTAAATRTTTPAGTTISITNATSSSIGTGSLNLPRVPWEGGPSYWGKFTNAAKGGWTNPSFFPIVAWYDGFSDDAEVQYDKAVGINTYIGMDNGTPFSLFTKNGVYWIGDKLNSSFDTTSGNWVGDFLDDEVDGRYTPTDGLAYLRSLVQKYGNDGRFKYANFTQIVTGDYGSVNNTASASYVNDFANPVSVDMYWYTIPHCSESPYRDFTLTPVIQSNCRTSSSYGRTMASLRQRDASDGKLQPLWQFIEILNGGPGPSAPAVYISPAQLKGAVMNSVINEARGIVYFNQSFSGNCQSSNVIRQSQVISGFCGAAQVAAAKTVNAQIRQLAPVLNSQSYVYSFGSGMDTMLKTYSGSAYVFAMVDGKTAPGSRTLRLPAGISGRSVEVLNENRSLTADASGSFTDSFAGESTYHIYRIKL